ncbi:hypothetical protein EOPP23_01385 [Endozoicomonas sp. OPT23]|uniref:YybH family protein n=1 Tax=Endozoicomonas sp. OPT23 TaxID=2072845 RepID=UPI00129BC3B7|nr:nuclear transport factor 2 family protein [Endozoicomonas sp. OPT23]MRI31646.1 hypothetical protein [Endozoicomonas sp. OPT23]
MPIKLTDDALAPFLELMKKYDHYMTNRDLESLMSLFVHDDEPHSFGLHRDLSSRVALKNRFKEYFENNEVFEAEKGEPTVFLFGEAACICTTLKAKADIPVKIRVTVFVENHSGEWLIRHQHLSRSPELVE